MEPQSTDDFEFDIFDLTTTDSICSLVAHQILSPEQAFKLIFHGEVPDEYAYVELTLDEALGEAA